MKKQITRISVLQSSKIMAALYAVMGLLYSIAGLVILAVSGPQMRVVGAIYLVAPIWLGILGFIFFALFAAIYNALAKALGGFEFEVENIEV
jgi:hypothetical protein